MVACEHDGCLVVWNRVVAVVIGPKVSERRLRSQSAFFMLCITATYSLSVMERETISWRLDDQKTALPSMRKA